MKKMLLVVCLSAMLGGCALWQSMTSPLHKELSAEQLAAESPQQKAMRLARNGVDELYGLIVSANRTISNNVSAEIWTPDQAQKYLDRSKDLRKQADKAEATLKLGNLSDAKTQTEAVKKLIEALQREIAAAARTP